MYINVMCIFKHQTSFYAQLARDSLKIGSISSTNIIFRRIKSAQDSSTEILNELGTTDVTIGVRIITTFLYL